MIKNLCSGIVFLRFEFWLTSYFLGDLFLLFDLQFPGGSDGKESACNAEDLGWISGLGGSPEEGNGNPLHCSSWRIPWTEKPGGLQFTG